MNQQRRGLALVISGGIMWGASGTMAQLMFMTQHVSSLWIVGIRLLAAGLLLLVSYRLMQHQSIWAIWHDRSFRTQLIWFALLGMLPSQLFYFLAIQYGNAATATVLQFTSPVFIIAYLAFRQRRLPTVHAAISIVMAVIGTVLLATKGHFDSLSLSPLGLIFGLGAGVANAAYTLIPAQLLKKYPAQLACGWAMLIGGIPFLPIVAFGDQPHFNIVLIMEVLFIIVIGTMLAYLFYVGSLKYLQPSVTGVLGAFEPLTATILAVTLLGLSLNGAEIIGGILILGMAMMQALHHD